MSHPNINLFNQQLYNPWFASVPSFRLTLQSDDTVLQPWPWFFLEQRVWRANLTELLKAHSSLQVQLQCVLLCLIEPMVRKIRNVDSNFPWIFSMSPAPRFLNTQVVCLLLYFIKPILGNHYVRSQGFIVSEPRETHPRSEITNVPTSFCLPLDELGCPDPHPPSELRRWLHRSPSSSSSNRPTTIMLTTRGLCPGGSVVWAGPKFVQPHR